jgi:hypothetical protein
MYSLSLAVMRGKLNFAIYDYPATKFTRKSRTRSLTIDIYSEIFLGRSREEIVNRDEGPNILRPVLYVE